jgi:hypothetical protein
MSERWLWTQKEDIGPTPRRNHAMAYEAARQRVVLFGGYNSFSPQSYLGDTWEWDGDAWTQVADMGPSPRRSFNMTYDDSRQRLVLFGGDVKASTTQANQVNGETWEWNGREWTQVADIGPPPRMGCAMAYDTLRHRVVVFGGFSYLPPPGKYFDDTWEWDGRVWTQRQDMGPSARYATALAYDNQRDRVVLFGGTAYGPPYGYLGDTWELEIIKQ